MKAPEKRIFKQPMGRPIDWTTDGYLDALALRHNARSDYALHQLLRVSRQTIYRYRDGKGTFDDDVALRVGELLGIPGEEMLLWAAMERARIPAAKQAWRLLAERLGGTAAAVLFVWLLAGSGAESQTAAGLPFAADHGAAVCIMSNLPIVIILWLFSVLAFAPQKTD